MDILEVVNKIFPIKSQIEVLEENENYLLVDKPAGVVVNRAVSHKGYTVQDWMKDRYPEVFNEGKIVKAISEIAKFKVNSHVDDYETTGLPRAQIDFETSDNLCSRNDDIINWDELNYWMFWERNGVVHRLDKETSGVMVLAKTPEEYVRLLGLFRERKVKKTYMALVHGLVKDDEGVIDRPLGRLPWNRTRFGVLAGGREAVSKYKVLERWSKTNPSEIGESGDYSLVELYPETGRTHQLRVHLLSIGHPIVGDPVYAGRKFIKQDEKWCGRLCLRAVELKLEYI